MTSTISDLDEGEGILLVFQRHAPKYDFVCSCAISVPMTLGPKMANRCRV